MNELSTKITKINFKWLIEHCTDKENWKRSWTLFDYDGCKCVMKIEKINIIGNTLVLKIIGSGLWNYGTIDIPLDKEHYNEIVFTKKLYNSILFRISEYEKELIMKMDLYEDAEERDSQSLEDFRIELYKHLDNAEVFDEEIREVYIDTKISGFYAGKYTDEVLTFYEKKKNPNHYAMLALQFDRQNDYEEIMNLSEIDEEELEENFKEIEYEYLNDINESLED